MKVLVVADVHANLAAFQAVLDDARRNGDVDALWCLGDIVGYGPRPVECIDLLRGFDHVAIAGNHDLAAAGCLSTSDFNPYARRAVEWTAAKLPAEQRAWLAGLPQVSIETDFTLVHGSLCDPVWDYLVSPWSAEEHFRLQTTAACLVGHSHLPLLFRETAQGPVGSTLEDGSAIEVAGPRFVANPGSVGQPRDGDPRAAYALLDTETRRIHFRRLAYDIERTQTLMRAEGLPSPLIERLSFGR